MMFHVLLIHTKEYSKTKNQASATPAQFKAVFLNSAASTSLYFSSSTADAHCKQSGPSKKRSKTLSIVFTDFEVKYSL